jgi:hypothetical protein
MNTYSSGPFTLNERLFSIGVRRLLIATRHSLDTGAAMAAAVSMTWPHFQFCNVSDAVATIRSIDAAHIRHTLVIADVNIQQPMPGVWPIEVALSRNALAFAIAGGPLSVRLLPCFDAPHDMLRGTTNDRNTWSSILHAFCIQASVREGFLHKIAKVWKMTGEVHPIVASEIVKQIRAEIAAAAPSDRAHAPAFVSAR